MRGVKHKLHRRFLLDILSVISNFVGCAVSNHAVTIAKSFQGEVGLKFSVDCLPHVVGMV